MNNTLTLTGYRLNKACILDRLIDVLVFKGGRLADTWPFVHTAQVYKVKNQYEPNEPELLLRTLSYVTFVYEDTYYYVQLGDNPFLDCLFVKEKLGDNQTISAGADGNELPFDWYLEDKSEYDYLDADEIYQAATQLFDYLVGRECTMKKPAQLRRKVKVI